MSSDVDCMGLVLSRLVGNPPKDYPDAAADVVHTQHTSSATSARHTFGFGGQNGAQGGDGEAEQGAGFQLVGLKLVPRLSDAGVHAIVPMFGAAPSGTTRTEWRAKASAALTAGPVLVLALRRVNAAAALEAAVGPLPVLTARAKAPDSLRALYVAPGVRQCCASYALSRLLADAVSCT